MAVAVQLDFHGTTIEQYDQINERIGLLPGGPASPQAAQIVQDFHGALVMVEGDKGVGSGFLCNMGGGTYAVTNAHVLADNAGIKFTNLDGAALVDEEPVK